jgi:hypothetical protein
MNFKTHLIAGACLAACSAASFGATVVKASCPSAAPTTSAAAVFYVNNCKPAYTVFVGGASTQSSNFATIVKATGLLDTAKMTPIVVNDKGSVSGLAGNVKALLGQTSSGQIALFVYNYNNGSAAGVSQLLGAPTKPSVAVSAGGIPESDVVFVGPAVFAAGASISVAPGTATGTPNNCVASASSTDAAPAVDCTSHTPQQADLAVADVAPAELYALYKGATKKLSTLTNTPLFLQSFGVVVSPALYTALQTKNLTEGTIPATCSAGDFTTAACQPTIRRQEYASLVAKGGKIKSLAALTGDASLTAQLTLARRDDLSGTQAVSNMFFVNGQCGGNGNKSVAKSVDALVYAAGGLLGGLAIDGIADSTTNLNILSAAVSGDVKNAVANTGYAIGVLNVGSGGTVSNSDAAVTSKGRFVRIDGLSPNYNAAGSTGAAVTRAQIANGAYPFAFTAYGSYVTATYAKFDATKKTLVDNTLAGFKSSSLSDLAGIAYLDGAVSAKQSAVNRTAGNNCSPITKL